jgi:hypothetical protein
MRPWPLRASSMSEHSRPPGAGRIHFPQPYDGVGAEIARRYRDDIPHGALGTEDNRLLSDLARGRYPIIGKLLRLARKCRTDNGRYALPEVSIEVLTPDQNELHFPDVVRSYDRELFEANAAVRECHLHNCDASRERARHELVDCELAARRLRECFAATSGVRS